METVVVGLDFYSLLVLKSVGVGLMLAGVTAVFGWTIGHGIRLFKYLSLK